MRMASKLKDAAGLPDEAFLACAGSSFIVLEPDVGIHAEFDSVGRILEDLLSDNQHDKETLSIPNRNHDFVFFSMVELSCSEPRLVNLT